MMFAGCSFRLLELGGVEEMGVWMLCALAVAGRREVANFSAKGMVEYGALVDPFLLQYGVALGAFGFIERAKDGEVTVKLGFASCVRDGVFGSIRTTLSKFLSCEVGEGSVGLDGDRGNMVERIKQPKLVVHIAAPVLDPSGGLDRDERGVV
ncbi:hypothetical protein CBR_g55637 [Chara braunii]|uniref:Uncharacterized protein n=1 Tax=Chara braunii TaxID=69332 RepID=A0A388MDB1_CHABU|nr:hypothetical protein CBR_g55637 [Chara braunii]|eukprot:GBG92485.1 hypothetical protein CBR_g55637 [Chara braunii]